jgi:hypothetical protein
VHAQSGLRHDDRQLHPWPRTSAQHTDQRLGRRPRPFTNRAHVSSAE